MTWHPLATNPLPEPREGQTLLIRSRPGRRPVSFTVSADLRWLDDHPDPYGQERGKTSSELRQSYVLIPLAEWHIVPAPGEPSEADELRKRVAELEDLVSRAIRCSHRVTSLKVPRWTCVKRVFSVGSTRAHELCRRLGLDPDEKVGGKS